MEQESSPKDISLIELEQQLLKLKLACVDKDWTVVAEVLAWFENEGYIDYDE